MQEISLDAELQPLMMMGLHIQMKIKHSDWHFV